MNQGAGKHYAAVVRGKVRWSGALSSEGRTRGIGASQEAGYSLNWHLVVVFSTLSLVCHSVVML